MTHSTDHQDEHRKRCQRPHCNRYVTDRSGKGFRTCSSECRWMLEISDISHNLAAAIGPNTLTDSLLMDVKELMRISDRIHRTRAELRRAAAAEGISGDAWGSLCRYGVLPG